VGIELTLSVCSALLCRGFSAQRYVHWLAPADSPLANSRWKRRRPRSCTTGSVSRDRSVL